MRLKTRYFLGFLILTVLVYIGYRLAVRQTENEIIVTVDDKLKIDKVRIEFGFYNSNDPGNDFNLTKNGLNKIVYEKNSRPFETICGENDFYLTYNNEYYTILRHHILNDFYDGIPKPHKYHFDLTKEGNDIKLKLKIIGPDGENREKKLLKIENSSKNFWGVTKK